MSPEERGDRRCTWRVICENLYLSGVARRPILSRSRRHTTDDAFPDIVKFVMHVVMLSVSQVATIAHWYMVHVRFFCENERCERCENERWMSVSLLKCLCLWSTGAWRTPAAARRSRRSAPRSNGAINQSMNQRDTQNTAGWRLSGKDLPKRVQLIDPILRETINPQQMFQYLESCHPTPTPRLVAPGNVAVHISFFWNGQRPGLACSSLPATHRRTCPRRSHRLACARRAGPRAAGPRLQQLLKMKAKGLLSLQEFLDLTKDLAGTDPERPICFDGASAPAADGQAPEASSAPAASPAPAPAPAAAGPSVAQAQEDFLRRLAGGGPSEREEAAAEQARPRRQARIRTTIRTTMKTSGSKYGSTYSKNPDRRTTTYNQTTPATYSTLGSTYCVLTYSDRYTPDSL